MESWAIRNCVCHTTNRYTYLYSPVERVQHELCQGHHLSSPVPAIRTMDKDWVGRVMDHTHHLTSHTKQLTQVTQPLGTLQTRQKATRMKIECNHPWVIMNLSETSRVRAALTARTALRLGQL